MVVGRGDLVHGKWDDLFLEQHLASGQKCLHRRRSCDRMICLRASRCYNVYRFGMEGKL